MGIKSFTVENLESTCKTESGRNKVSLLLHLLPPTSVPVREDDDGRLVAARASARLTDNCSSVAFILGFMMWIVSFSFNN